MLFSAASIFASQKQDNLASIKDLDYNSQNLVKLYHERLKNRTANLDSSKTDIYLDLNDKKITQNILKAPVEDWPLEKEYDNLRFALLEKAGFLNTSYIRPKLCNKTAEEIEDDKKTSEDLRIIKGETNDEDRHLLSILQSYCETNYGKEWIKSHFKELNTNLGQTLRIQNLIKNLVEDTKFFNQVSFKIRELSNYLPEFNNNIESQKNYVGEEWGEFEHSPDCIVKKKKETGMSTQKMVEKTFRSTFGILNFLSQKNPRIRLKLALPYILGSKYGNKTYSFLFNSLEKNWAYNLYEDIKYDYSLVKQRIDEVKDAPKNLERIFDLSKGALSLNGIHQRILGLKKDATKAAQEEFKSFITTDTDLAKQNLASAATDLLSGKVANSISNFENSVKNIPGLSQFYKLYFDYLSRDLTPTKTPIDLINIMFIPFSVYCNGKHLLQKYSPLMTTESRWHEAKQNHKKAIICQKFFSKFINLGKLWDSNKFVSQRSKSFKNLKTICDAFSKNDNSEKYLKKINKKLDEEIKKLYEKCTLFEKENQNEKNKKDEKTIEAYNPYKKPEMLENCFDLSDEKIKKFATEIKEFLDSDYFKENTKIDFDNLKSVIKKLNDKIFSKNSPQRFNLKYLGYGHLFKSQNILKELSTCSNILRPALISLGEMDGLVALATMFKRQMKSKNKFCFVKFIKNNEKPIIKLENCWNPLVKGEKKVDFSSAVPSNFEVGTDNSKHILITGPNFKGKSTAIRTISYCVWMGQAFGIAPASSTEFTPIDTIYSMKKDMENTAKGMSSHKGQLDQVNKLIQKIEQKNNEGKKMLVLADEIFNGTNSLDAASLIIACSEEIIKKGPLSCWIMSSHSKEAYRAEYITNNAVKNLKIHEGVLYKGFSPTEISSNEELIKDIKFSDSFINRYSEIKSVIKT